MDESEVRRRVQMAYGVLNTIPVVSAPFPLTEAKVVLGSILEAPQRVSGTKEAQIALDGHCFFAAVEDEVSGPPARVETGGE